MDNARLQLFIETIVKEVISNEDLRFWTDSYRTNSFETPEEAREFIFQQREHARKQGWGGTPEENRKFANEMPISKIGKKFKIGERPKKSELNWQTVEIKPNSTEVLATEGFLNPFDGERLGRTQIVPITKLVSNETHSQTPQGKLKVKSIALSLKSTSPYFVPIVIDESGNIVDGHHRYEAVKLLKLKTVPIQVILGRQ